MAGTPPRTVSIEYARGTGAFFPSNVTTATESGVAQAVESVNGISASAVTIAAGNSSGATVNITESGDTISIGVSVTQQGAGVGTSYPPSPVTGQLFYNTTLGHLYVWTGAAWSQA